MKITVAKTAGFCFGVDRAVQMVNNLIDEGRRVCTLGPIIHNPQLVGELTQKGVGIVYDAGDTPENTTLVIRSHGVGREVYDRLGGMGVTFADATCPFVSKIHKIAVQGGTVLIAGDGSHPEVEGIRGHCAGEAYVFSNERELDALLENHPEMTEIPLTVVAQTTFSQKEWEQCEKKIKKVCTNAKIFGTICSATFERQSEALELSLVCDYMIIVGGRDSSNTQKLFAICDANTKTVLIETAGELDAAEAGAHCHIGVTAGASTPARIIKEVLEAMSLFEEQNEQIEEVIENIENIEGAVISEEPTAAEPAEAEEAAETVETAAEEAPVSEEAQEIVVEEVAPKSFEDMTFEEALEHSLNSLNTDEKVKGIVVGIAPNEIQVDVGRKQAGYIPIDEYSNDPNAIDEVKIGDELELLIMRTNDQEGTIMLSKKRVDALKGWDIVIAACDSEEVLDGKVTEVINGGVLAVTNGVRVFIPASLTGVGRGDPLDGLLKQDVKFRIIEVNKQRRRAVGSIRAVRGEQRRAVNEEFWKDAEEGKVYTGTVKSLMTYGAFVDIGGIDGMIHISELSWKRIKHPSDVLEVGDTVEVYIKKLNQEAGKISLGYKKTEDNPWNVLKANFEIGQTISTKIASLTAFGAFAEVTPGIDGLIHISQISYEHIAKPADVLEIGQDVEVKIMDIDFDKKRVNLSIKALLTPPEPVNAGLDAVDEVVASTEMPVEPEVVSEAAAEILDEAPVAVVDAPEVQNTEDINDDEVNEEV